MSSTLYSQLADALRENAVNREAIEQQDALILQQNDEITQLHAHVAEQADYIATLEQHLVEAQRDLEREKEALALEKYKQWCGDFNEEATEAQP